MLPMSFFDRVTGLSPAVLFSSENIKTKENDNF